MKRTCPLCSERQIKMSTYREHTKVIQIGNRKIGGGNPTTLIESMTNTKTEDVQATIAQILALEKAGCDIIRCAVPTMEAALALKEIKKQIHIPLVADIHFDYRLAIAAMENGADKIRINPGNIGSIQRIKAVVDVAKREEYPHPCRRKQWFPGKGSGREIPRGDSRGACGKRTG